MKAKECLQKFEEDSLRSGDREATINLMGAFLLEIKELTEKRKAQSNSSMVSILKELGLKWNALCRMDKKKRFKKDGFRKLVLHRCAEDHPQIVFKLEKEDW